MNATDDLMVYVETELAFIVKSLTVPKSLHVELGITECDKEFQMK